MYVRFQRDNQSGVDGSGTLVLWEMVSVCACVCMCVCILHTHMCVYMYV
jgi:hypothetical protein